MQDQERNFFLLVFGQMVSLFGSAVYLVSVVLFIRDITDDAGALGLFQMTAHIPILVLAPLAGAVTERFSRKKLIILTDALRGLLMMLAALAAWTGRLGYTGLLILTVLISMNSAIFLPASHAFFPELVVPSMIRRRNSLKSVLLLLANFGGTAAGGVAYARFSVSAIFLFNGLTFLFSALQESFIRTTAPAAVPVRPKPQEKAGKLSSSGGGGTAALLIIYAMIHALSPPLILSLPFLLDERYSAASSAFGLSLSLLLAGGGAGALMFGYLPVFRKSGSLAFFSALFALPVLIISAGTGTQLPLLYIALAAAGICIGLLYQIITTSLYLHVPEGVRGRVFARLEALANFSTPVSYGVSGIMIQMMRSRLPRFYLITATVLGLLSLALVFRGRPGRVIDGGKRKGASQRRP